MESITEIKLGIIGMSKGNGHPYSWSAIFNGYDTEYMKDCPFPVIPEYLAKQKFPQDAIPNARVTHIWTQEKSISKHIAKAAKIPNIVNDYQDLIGKVDAVLLARDDSEHHLNMSKPFLSAGIPIFIDKPLAFSVSEAKKMLALEQYEGQLFSCSSLRYAKEFTLSAADHSALGKIKLIDATIPKSWEKYAVHIIEPVLRLLPFTADNLEVINTGKGEINVTTVNRYDNITLVFKVLGNTSCPLSIRIFGDKSYKELIFKDTYYAFKTSLEYFLKGIHNQSVIIPRRETLSVIDIIEKGFLKK